MKSFLPGLLWPIQVITGNNSLLKGNNMLKYVVINCFFELEYFRICSIAAGLMELTFTLSPPPFCIFSIKQCPSFHLILTDTFDALKKADSFLATLLVEHDAVGARAQLKTLWIGYVRAVLQEDEEARLRRPWRREQGEVGTGVFVSGPRPRKKARRRVLPAVQPETSHAHVVDCG